MLIRAAALLGFFTVALGAFGAHALDGQLTVEGTDWWHTATLYALFEGKAQLFAAVIRDAAEEAERVSGSRLREHIVATHRATAASHAERRRKNAEYRKRWHK